VSETNPSISRKDAKTRRVGKGTKRRAHPEQRKSKINIVIARSFVYFAAAKYTATKQSMFS
jgi:hypothetical protein